MKNHHQRRKVVGNTHVEGIFSWFVGGNSLILTIRRLQVGRDAHF
jgi:hypothetical protein